MLKALYVILISLGLALIFNFLFFNKLVGISVLIFVLVLLGAVFFSGLRQLSLRKTWWLIPLIVFFALMPSIRANEFLTFLNICVTLGLLMLLAHELTGTPTFLMRLRDYLALVILMPLRMLGSAVSTVIQVSQIHSSVKHRDMWLRVMKGMIMAVPILIIFGILFSQADLAFSQFLTSFININISERTVQYFILLVFAFVLALSFLSYLAFPKPKNNEKLPNGQSNIVHSGRSIEVMVFLGLICALFAVFIGFQITYLFGGESNIINAGFTYADYARRGFFELLAVAVLSLVLLLASEKYLRMEKNKNYRFLFPALLLIAEVGVVIFSAFKRLSLYIDAYSMTILRFYVSGFIILLSVLFILLAVKLIKSKQEQFFTFGTLFSIVAILIAVNLINPDAFIAKSNLNQFTKTGKIDAGYLRELSVDAESIKIELYDKLQEMDKETLRQLLKKDKDKLQKNTDWRSTNLSRSKALKLLQEIK